MKLQIFMAFIFIISSFLSANDNRWIWIHGRLTDPVKHKEYMKFTDQLIRYYGKGGILISKISEKKSMVKSYPENYTMVWCGPLEAFKHLDQADLPVKVKEKEIEISGKNIYQRS